MAKNLPNDCIEFSIPSGMARDETAIAILLSQNQRAEILKTDKLAADARNASSEGVALATSWT